jgi:hypothetical protein
MKEVIMDRQYQSEQINELAAALAKAQSEMTHAAKGVDNTFFKSKYADLPAVIDAARPHLAKNNLSVVQITDFDEAGLATLVTQLIHSSGQWMRSWYPVRPVKNDPQGFGSALTYARRYSYAAITGTASIGEDDDGNAASGNTNKADAPISTEQAVEIDLLITEVNADKANFLKYLGVDDVRKIPSSKRQMAVDALNKKRAAV